MLITLARQMRIHSVIQRINSGIISMIAFVQGRLVCVIIRSRMYYAKLSEGPHQGAVLANKHEQICQSLCCLSIGGPLALGSTESLAQGTIVIVDFSTGLGNCAVASPHRQPATCFP